VPTAKAGTITADRRSVPLTSAGGVPGVDMVFWPAAWVVRASVTSTSCVWNSVAIALAAAAAALAARASAMREVHRGNSLTFTAHLPFAAALLASACALSIACCTGISHV
jgi:hypothetical protein